MKIIVIGGGPIGVEAALYGACAGFDVTLYERGQLADNVRRWGFVQVFTEWGRNRSPLAVQLLQQQGAVLPPDGEYSSGDELAEYVSRITSIEPLRNRIFTNTEVLSITREACLRSDFIGQARRQEYSFRLLLRDENGNERTENCDAVIDATGVYTSPNPVGSGGAPCPGELNCKDRVDYALPDVAGKERARFAGKSTLVVGSGHSAASTLLSVADLMKEFPDTKLVWVVRRNVPEHGAPYTLVPEETSTTRARLHRRTNELIHHPNVTFLHSSVVESLSHDGRQFHVEVSTHDGVQSQMTSLVVDNIAAHTGFRADTALWQELPIETHPPTGAPRKLGEALQAHNRRSGIGLSTGYAEKQPLEEIEEEEKQSAPDRWSFLINDPQLLETGEPNFFVLGIKSYGRDAGFLMHNGFRQVRDVYKLLSGDMALDLYNGSLDAKP
jgi:thioredoxin reductase